MNLFVIKGISDAPLSKLVEGAATYLAIMLLGLVILIAFPGPATCLPYSAGFGR